MTSVVSGSIESLSASTKTSLTTRLHELAEKEATRADKLQRRLDDERNVASMLRQQLKDLTNTQQQTTQQLRALQGAAGAAGATPGARSVPALEKAITRLRDQLDLEKKATNAERAERQRVAVQLSDAVERERQLTSSQDELRRTLERRAAEAKRMGGLLREASQAHDTALAELQRERERHEKERQGLYEQQACMREELELERLRATAGARRVEEKELRREREEMGHAGAAPRRVHAAEEARLQQLQQAAADALAGGGEEDESTVASGAEGGERPKTPSASVQAMMERVENEERRAREAEAQAEAARAEAQLTAEAMREARAEAETLHRSLERSQLEAGATPGARSTLKTLERQLEAQKLRAERSAQQRQRAVTQLHQLRASVAMLADAHCGAAILGAAAAAQPAAPAPGGTAAILEGVADEAAEAAGLTSEEETRALRLIEASLLAAASSQAAGDSTAASPPLHERLSRPASHEKLAMAAPQPSNGPATPSWKSAAGGERRGERGERGGFGEGRRGRAEQAVPAGLSHVLLAGDGDGGDEHGSSALRESLLSEALGRVARASSAPYTKPYTRPATASGRGGAPPAGGGSAAAAAAKGTAAGRAASKTRALDSAFSARLVAAGGNGNGGAAARGTAARGTAARGVRAPPPAWSEGLQAQLARGLAEVDPNVSPAGSPQVEVLTRQQIKSQVQSQVLLHTSAKEAAAKGANGRGGRAVAPHPLAQGVAAQAAKTAVTDARRARVGSAPPLGGAARRAVVQR